jgi:hypothetical protein
VFLASSMPFACLVPFGSQPIGLLTGKPIGESPVVSYKLTLLALIQSHNFLKLVWHSAFLYFSDNIGFRKLLNLQICPTLCQNFQGATFLIEGVSFWCTFGRRLTA